jgi:hypothetical protein
MHGDKLERVWASCMSPSTWIHMHVVVALCCAWWKGPDTFPEETWHAASWHYSYHIHVLLVHYPPVGVSWELETFVEASARRAQVLRACRDRDRCLTHSSMNENNRPLQLACLSTPIPGSPELRHAPHALAARAHPALLVTLSLRYTAKGFCTTV